MVDTWNSHFFRFNIQFVLEYAFQHEAYVINVLSDVLWVNEYIVQVDENEMIKEVSENVFN